MRLLVADDDRVWRRALEIALGDAGYDVAICSNGTEAWKALQVPDAPALAILDWQMPGLTGIDICRRLREAPRAISPYVILLTSLNLTDDVVAGLRAGADDYICKPFAREELHARVQVGTRTIALQRALDARVRELEAALANIKRLQGLLPICSYCKRIRHDGQYWQQVDTYISEPSEVSLSHGICPSCYDQVVEPELCAHANRMSA